MNGFLYPDKPHQRKHGPYGYANYKAYKPWLRDEFTFRCVYCLVRETWNPSGVAAFSTDHFIPQIVDPTKIVDYDNLLYACIRCNSWKQDNTILDPCEAAMSKHLHIENDGSIKPLTTDGAEHVELLELDDPVLTEFRGRLISTLQRLQSLPDEHAQSLVRKWLGFPDDLPNLSALRPPEGNKRPTGVAECYFKQKQMGRLPEIY